MKKIAMIIGVLSILATSANAAWISTYSNGMGGYNFYSSSSGYLGFILLKWFGWNYFLLSLVIKEKLKRPNLSGGVFF